MNISLLSLLLLLLFALDDQQEMEKLYKAIQDGNRDAFKQFFDSHYKNLLLYLLNRNITQEEAEDLIQNGFIYIWENRKNINPRLSLKSYLYRIVYTRMLNHLEQKKETETLPDEISYEYSNPVHVTGFRELEAALKKAVRQMPERRRAVFEYCFLQEFTYRETAEILSVSIKTVENHMALALRDVRSSLKRFKKNLNHF